MFLAKTVNQRLLKSYTVFSKLSATSVESPYQLKEVLSSLLSNNGLKFDKVAYSYFGLKTYIPKCGEISVPFAQNCISSPPRNFTNTGSSDFSLGGGGGNTVPLPKCS